MYGPAQAELDLATGELLDDGPGVGERAGQAVELGDDEGVARPAGSQRLTKTGPLPVGPGQALVDVDPLGGDAEGHQGIPLGGQVLFVGGDPGIADQQRFHDFPSW